MVLINQSKGSVKSIQLTIIGCKYFQLAIIYIKGNGISISFQILC